MTGGEIAPLVVGGVGREIGEVESDKEGMRTMKVLGENMAWLLSKLHG